MLDFIIIFLIQVVSIIINVIFWPIDQLITTFAPNITTSFGYIHDYLAIITNGAGYAISLTMLPPFVWQIVVVYYIFKLNFPLAVHTIKSIVKWYSALK